LFKTFTRALAIVMVGMVLVGCENSEDTNEERVSFEDGTYRGSFSDRDEMHVGIQITLEDNIVTEISHRHMAYRGTDYLADDADDTTQGIAEQHKKAVEHLVGKDIRDHLADLYEPGEHVDFGDVEDVDGFSGATIYSQKEISAIVDALDRGVYRFREVGGEVPEGYSPLD